MAAPVSFIRLFGERRRCAMRSRVAVAVAVAALVCGGPPAGWSADPSPPARPAAAGGPSLEVGKTYRFFWPTSAEVATVAEPPSGGWVKVSVPFSAEGAYVQWINLAHIHSIREEPATAVQLVGAWKLTKSTTPSKEKSAFLVFAKDGALTADEELPDRTVESRGTWKTEGNKLVRMWREKGRKDEVVTDTIIKLTADELVIRGDDGEQLEFKRMAEEKK